MIKKKNKIIYIMLIMIYILNAFSGIVSAEYIDSAKIVNLGDCGQHLQFWDTKINNWSYVITNLVGYEYNNQIHYAYCLNANANGVGEVSSYNVDVTKLLDDVRIWRAITAGFPYKTYQELGCSTPEDAFVATKQAVYCVLYGFTPETRYKGADSRGQSIKNAIVSITNEGRNGTRTPQSANVSIDKVGNLYQEGDYYFQEFSVSSFVNIGNYTITATNGLPEETKIVNMNNEEQNSFNGNEHFKVKIPTNKIIDDIQANILIRTSCETYPIFYGKAPSSNYQNYALTFDPFYGEQGMIELNIDAHKSSIKVIKEDSETKYRIPNVVFNFRYADGENIGNYTTDQNGEITIEHLRQGTIIVTELETNENYILDSEERKINLSYAESKTLTIENERKRGNLVIYKVDKDNNKIGLGNVAFDLYSKELGRVINTYYTDENGIIKINNLRVGEYSLIEKKTNKWYNLSENKDIKIEWNKTNETTIENELKKGQIRIIKVDADNNSIFLEGIKFGIYDKDNNLLETIVTNKEGKALSKRYPLRDFETLKIVELETKEEYQLNSEEKTIKLEENQIKDVVFENEKIKGKIKITKVDLKDNTKKLEGAKFGIYNENDELVQTIITDENGEATSEILYKGKYYCKELDTGSNYYLLNENIYEFEIVEHNKIVEKVIENEPVDIEVNIDKEGDIETQPGKIVNYNFSNIENASNTYLQSFKWYDYIPTEYVRIDKLQTGTWNQDLNYKIYYKTNKSEDYILLKENLNTKENYEIDFNMIELQEDEYITEFCCDFGEVDIGFKEETGPSLTCRVLDNVEDKETFTNHTEVEGNFYDLTTKTKSEWTTIVNKPKEKEEILPKTGK